MATGTSDAVAEALFEALNGTDPATLQRVADELRAWRERYPRSAAGISGFAAKLLHAIDEAVELGLG